MVEGKKGPGPGPRRALYNTATNLMGGAGSLGLTNWLTNNGLYIQRVESVVPMGLMAVEFFVIVFILRKFAPGSARPGSTAHGELWVRVPSKKEGNE